MNYSRLNIISVFLDELFEGPNFVSSRYLKVTNAL